MSTNGQLVFTDVDKITFKGVGNTSNAVVDTVTGKIGVGIDSPDANLHVLGNSYVSTNLELGGTLIMGTVNVEAQHSLEAITATGNTTPLTVEFSNATTGIVTTGNVEVGGELTVSGNVEVGGELTVSGNVEVGGGVVSNVNLLSVSNVASIKMDSNVVTEYTGPHNRPLRKYPEVPMTSNNNSSTSGYFVAQSYYSTNSFDTRKAWNLFNHVTSGAADGGYHALKLGLHYSQTDGTYNHTPAESLGGVNGPWLYIRLPKKISLDHVKLISRAGYPQRVPRSATFLGSNNGTNWENIFSFSDVSLIGDSSSGEHTYTYNVNSTVKYEYFGFVWEKMGVEPLNSFINMEELELYGYEEGDGSLDTTLKSVYNVPATTGTQLEVYYDGRDYSGVPSSVADKTGNGHNGTIVGNGVGFDSTYKAFTFAGSDDYFHSTLDWSGDQVHSVSFWVKSTTVANQTPVLLGTAANSGWQNQFSAFELRTDGRIKWYFGDNDIQYSANWIPNTWIHLAFSYIGGGSNGQFKSAYMNGRKLDVIVEPTTSTAVSFNSGDTVIRVGGGYFDTIESDFTGSIANVRIYEKALNAEQIQELYDYQKDYFLGSKSQVTLYKGHLGVGVTEPSGQLELAGDERIQEYPPRSITVLNYHTHIEGHGEFEFSSNPSSYTGSTDWDLTKAFENTGRAGVGWHGNSTSAPGAYQAVLQYAPAVTSGDGFVESILKDGSTIFGEWIQMHSPYAINVTRLATAPRTNYGNSRGIGKFAILGSNNGIDWEYAGDGAIAPYDPSSSTDAGGYGTRTSETIAHVSTNSNGHYYTYHRLVVTHIMGHRGASGHPNYSSGGSESVNQSYIRFYGTPDSTTLDKGSLSLTRSLDVPRVSRYDVDTETPRPEKLILDLDTTVNTKPTDISGKGNHGQFYGVATYSAADKAFTGFTSGTSNHIRGNLNGVSGAYAHTQSYWVNGADTTPRAAFTVGVETGNYSFLNIWFTTSKWVLNGDGAAGGEWAETIYDNRWYHVVLTYDGGSSASSYKLYINGEYKTPTTAITTTTSLALPSDPQYRVGRNNGTQWYNGIVSNIKVYSVVLEPSEVKKLYKLGRTGRSMIMSDTAVGIGKAPEAQLDVRGAIYSTRHEAQSMIVRSRKDSSWASSNQPYDGKGFTIAKEENPLGEVGADRYWQFNMHSNYNLHIASNGRYTCYISQNAADVSLNFTGQHRCFIKDVPFTQAKELEGLVVSSDQNKYIKMNDGIEKGSNAITTNESLPIVSLSKTQSDKKCFGVISSAEDSEIRSDQYGVFNSIFVKEKGDTRVYINSVGEGAIWVANTNGSLEAGDYITTSNVAGYGQKQDSAGLMNYTVAKITMDCDFNPETHPIQKIKKKQEITRYWRSSSGEESTEEKDGFDELVEKVEIVNDLDEHGQIQWEDDPTETEKAYKVRYLTVDGTQTDEANAVHTAAFVGCTYHCG